MGVDLKFLPFAYEGMSSSFSDTVLSLTRRRELFDEIREIDTKEVPDTFDTYVSREEMYIDVDVDVSELPPHFGNTQTDPYDDPVEWCFVKDLTELSDLEGVQDNPKNRAIWAYLEELPDKKKVALYWK